MTGGIAVGKSTVSAYLEKKGAFVVDADGVGHQVLEPGQKAFPLVVEQFGEGILDSTGKIDRKQLGGIVFTDPEKLKTLNSISHPLMAEIMAQQILQAKNTRPPYPLIVLDAAIIFEAGWDKMVEQVWCVTLPVEKAVERLVKNKALTPNEAKARAGVQIDSKKRENKSDRIIDNTGGLEQLWPQIDRLWAEIVSENT